MTDQSNERDGNEPDGVLSWFVDRPVLTSMVSLTLLLVGIISFSRLPLALTPEGLTADTLNVIVPVRGASMSPTEVEELIVRPFEEQLGTVAGIDRVRSRASSGRASFNIRLEQGADLTIVTSEVRDRAQRAQLEWPEDSNRFLMWREDGSSAPLAFVQFLAPARNPEWDYLIDKVLRPRIEAVDGVGRLDVFGILDETIRVQFDREKLIEFRLDYGQLLQRLSSENFVEPVGELDDGSSRYLLRVDTRFAEDRQIEEWPIRTGLTLQDVATIERVPSIRDSLSRFATPSKTGEAMQAYYTYTAIVRAAAGSNQVEASESLVRALEDLRSEDPRFEKFDWRFLFNQGTLIKSSLDTLLNTSLQGAGLALVVLWLFLRSVRFTVTIALAIPGALLVAGAFLFFSKSSLNLLTMAGMTLAVGMVVDNAVVVLENIQRLRGKGMPARDACVRGTRDVVLALSMATLTTVAVLVPFMFVGEDGNLRVALTAFGMPVCVALIGSLGVALLLLPGGVRFLAGRDAVRTPATEQHGLGLLFDPVSLVTRMNRLLLQLSLQSFWTRTTAALALAGVLATVAIPFSNIDYVDADGGGPFSGGDVTINLEIPRGYTLRDVDQRVREYEQFIGGHADEWDVRFVSTRFDRTSIRVDIALAEDIPREIAVKTGNVIRNAWPRVPGITQTLRNAGGNDGAGAGSEEKSQNNFVVRLYGPNSDFLAQLAVRTQKRLAARREVERVEVGSIDGNSEVVVQVDRDQMQRLGVDPAQLARVAGAGLRGTELTRIEDRGREIPLIAEFAGGTPGLFDLGETRVFARQEGGGFASARLADITAIGFEQALGTINRIDGRTQVSLVGRRMDGVDSRQMTTILRDEMAALSLPRGYEWEEASASVETRGQLDEIMQAVPLVVVLLFLMMGVLFESVIVPGAILITIPFAIFGAFWTLFLCGGTFDVMAGIGLVLLIGVVVNNGIVLLDSIEKLRRDGMERQQAILEGTRLRLRPIFMTAATTVFGLLPMAVFGESTSGEGISYVSMSIAVSGGLAFCTFFTAFSVPLLYTFLEDFANWLRGVRHVIMTGTLEHPPHPPQPAPDG